MMNGLEDRISICLADIKEFTGGPFDAVVTNPPYRPVGSGRINPFSEKAIARHEIKLELDDMLACSRMLLKESGRFYAIYPAWRMPDMFCKMRNYDIEPKRIAMVHSHAASRASLFLVKGIKGAGREMSADAPMIVYESGKEYSDRMKRLFRTLNFI
jgi:tRNA1Val (adenine37-N6)-methyltransferase